MRILLVLLILLIISVQTTLANRYVPHKARKFLQGEAKTPTIRLFTPLESSYSDCVRRALRALAPTVTAFDITFGTEADNTRLESLASDLLERKWIGGIAQVFSTTISPDMQRMGANLRMDFSKMNFQVCYRFNF